MYITCLLFFSAALRCKALFVYRCVSFVRFGVKMKTGDIHTHIIHIYLLILFWCQLIQMAGHICLHGNKNRQCCLFRWNNRILMLWRYYIASEILKVNKTFNGKLLTNMLYNLCTLLAIIYTQGNVEFFFLRADNVSKRNGWMCLCKSLDQRMTNI